MKKLIKTLLIITIFSGMAAQCFAQTLSADQFKALVSAQAKKICKNSTLMTVKLL